MFTGTIKTWNSGRGFGFVQRDGGEPDVFVHVSAMAGSGKVLSEGQRVSFDVAVDARNGKLAASNVRVI